MQGKTQLCLWCEVIIICSRDATQYECVIQIHCRADNKQIWIVFKKKNVDLQVHQAFFLVKLGLELGACEIVKWDWSLDLKALRAKTKGICDYLFIASWRWFCSHSFGCDFIHLSPCNSIYFMFLSAGSLTALLIRCTIRCLPTSLRANATRHLSVMPSSAPKRKWWGPWNFFFFFPFFSSSWLTWIHSWLSLEGWQHGRKGRECPSAKFAVTLSALPFREGQRGERLRQRQTDTGT